MNRAPVISVCIPAYRRSGFLKRLLDSLAAQTYTDFEIVLTDDSPDDEVSNLVRAHSLSKRIRYFKNPVALGTPENWNESLRKATGEWIKIMHDDDWFVSPGSLSQFAAVIPSSASSFYFSAYFNVSGTGESVKPFSAGNFAGQLAKTPEILLASNRIGPPSVVLFRAQPGLLFDNSMHWLVDIDFYIRYLRQFPPAVYLPEPLVNIGISDSQVTRSSFGNPAVEVPEWSLIGAKLGYSSLKDAAVYNSWWRFLRNAGIRSGRQLRDLGYKDPVPEFLLSMISWQKQFPGNLLKSGIFSHLLMRLHRLANSRFQESSR